jgi:hypothetical protein
MAGDPMTQSWLLFVILVFSPVAFAGCEVIGDVFKAGVWVGAVAVIGTIGLIVWAVSKAGS